MPTPPCSRQIALTFVPSNHNREEFDLVRLGVEAHHASVQAKADRYQADSFEWDRDQGLAALTLFMLEAITRREDPPTLRLQRPRPLMGHLIWELPIDQKGNPDPTHPFRKIWRLMYNRAKSSYYLYHLFYHAQFETLGIRVEAFSGLSDQEISIKLDDIEGAANDRFSNQQLRTYGKRVFLGCLIRERIETKEGPRLRIYYAEAPKHPTQIQTKLVSFTSNKSRDATLEERQRITRSLRRKFPEWYPNNESRSPSNKSPTIKWRWRSGCSMAMFSTSVSMVIESITQPMIPTMVTSGTSKTSRLN